jgi:hypothetical protein
MDPVVGLRVASLGGLHVRILVPDGTVLQAASPELRKGVATTEVLGSKGPVSP